MFRYLNQVPMCSGSEDTAKHIFSAPFGGHLEFIKIIFRLNPSCFPAILSPIIRYQSYVYIKEAI